MFRFLNEMMLGQHDELPRRRRVADVEFDPARGFVAGADPEPSPFDTRWLGRGELPPGVLPRGGEVVTEGVSVAEEARALAQTPATSDREPPQS